MRKSITISEKHWYKLASASLKEGKRYNQKLDEILEEYFAEKEEKM